MTVLYLDCFAGISGDMFLGALVDLGLSCETLSARLSKLPVEGWEIRASKAVKNGITGTKVDVITTEQKSHRHLKQIVELIDAADLDPIVKQRSTAVFHRLAEAEAQIHNTTPEKIHFHEVGAIDAIVDIVGAMIGIRELGIGAVYASPISLGRGFVECQHGRIPIPAPATLKLLEGVPVVSSGIEAELTTPTGAAIVTTLADRFGEMPAMSIGRIGYGAGNRDLEIPNLLRAIIGEETDHRFLTDTVALIETNIDDISPELTGYAIERLFQIGALDVYTTSIGMKKNRPGVMLAAMAPLPKQDEIIREIFRQTGSLGVRVRTVHRKILERETITVGTVYGDVRVKIGRMADGVVSVAPEYDDCRKLADDNSVPLKQVYGLAQEAAHQQIK